VSTTPEAKAPTPAAGWSAAERKYISSAVFAHWSPALGKAASTCKAALARDPLVMLDTLLVISADGTPTLRAGMVEGEATTCVLRQIYKPRYAPPLKPDFEVPISLTFGNTPHARCATLQKPNLTSCVHCAFVPDARRAICDVYIRDLRNR